MHDVNTTHIKLSGPGLPPHPPNRRAALPLHGLGGNCGRRALARDRRAQGGHDGATYGASAPCVCCRRAHRPPQLHEIYNHQPAGAARTHAPRVPQKGSSRTPFPPLSDCSDRCAWAWTWAMLAYPAGVPGHGPANAMHSRREFMAGAVSAGPSAKLGSAPWRGRFRRTDSVCWYLFVVARARAQARCCARAPAPL